MARLADLPAELHYDIIRQLNQHDQASLGQACKAMQRQIEPFLYSEFSYTMPLIIGTYQSNSEKELTLHRFFRSIVCRPERALNIRKVSFRGRSASGGLTKNMPVPTPESNFLTVFTLPETQRLAKTLAELNINVALDLSAYPHLNVFATHSTQDQSIAMLDILLLLACNIERVSLSIDLAERESASLNFLSFNHNAGHAALRYPHLTYFNLSILSEVLGEKRASLSASNFYSLFYAPAIRSITVLEPDLLHPWPEPPPMANSLRNLTLVCPYLPERLDAMLKSAPALTNLVCVFYLDEADSRYNHSERVDGNQLRAALDNVKRTLKMLDMRYEYWYSGYGGPFTEAEFAAMNVPIEGTLNSLGRLSSFERLESLSLNFTLLLGTFGISPALHEILPRKLQYLFLLDDGWTWDDAGWLEESTREVCFTFLRNFKETTPDLVLFEFSTLSDENQLKIEKELWIPVIQHAEQLGLHVKLKLLDPFPVFRVGLRPNFIPHFMEVTSN